MPLLVTLALALPPAVGAQQRPAVSLQVGVGFGTGVGGDFRDTAGFSLDGLVALRFRPLFRHGAVAAVGGGMQGMPGTADDCLPTPSGGCVPDFPLFYSAVALIGWESATAGGPSVRVLGGPAYYRADGGGAALGLEARVDAATPSLLHVALVVCAQGTVLPNFRGEALGLAAATLGLRVQ